MSTPLPRGEFTVTRHCTYLNHAAVGVPPQTTIRAVEALLRAHGERGVLGTAPFEARMPEFRARIAGLIGATESEIALMPHTSAGAAAIALGIR